MPNLGPKPSTDAKQTIITIKQPKATLQPLKCENWQRVRSFTFVLLCQPFKKNKERTRKQGTKKHQETRKQRKSKKPKN